MSLLDAMRHRLRPLLRRNDFDRELHEEFRHHVALRAQEFPDGDHATARARAKFGSEAYYLEETRRMTALGALDALRQDLRYAWRNLRRTPAFTAVAILSLAIGIGANTAIFGLLYALLLQPLPLPHPEQLVELRHATAQPPVELFSYNSYRALSATDGFSGLTALAGASDVPITAAAARRTLNVDAVDGNFFGTLGVTALRGRLISADDERLRAPALVISEDLWATLFNRAPDAIGSTITLQQTVFTVIGVVPRSYRGLEYTGHFQAAVPLSTLPLVGSSAVETTDANTASIQIIGRLTKAGSAARVGESIDRAYRACCAAEVLATGAAGVNGAHAIEIASIEHGIMSSKFDVTAIFGRLLVELMCGAAIVLLAACANIGTLLLARASARQRELAVRLSLGASRRRLAVQMVVESGVLAILGSAAGLLVAWWALHLIAHRLPDPVVDRAGLHLNRQILTFTAATAIVAVLLFGGVPAWRATRTDLLGSLKAGGPSTGARRTGWLDRGIVVVQVAIALVLVNGAGLFVATLRNLRNVDAGFAAERVVSIELSSRETPYERSGFASIADAVQLRAARLPGVQSAALSLAAPVFGGRRMNAGLAIEGYLPGAGENMGTWTDPVSPGYFATIGTPLRAGRDFSPDDRAAGQQVAIVNEAFVRQYVRGRNPLGAHLSAAFGADTVPLQVVGVVGDARYLDPRQPAEPMLFVPIAQFAHLPTAGRLAVLAITVHTSGDDRGVPAALRNAMVAEAPDANIYDPDTIESAIDSALNRETLTAVLATMFGAVALVLAAIGLYGLVSYHVAQRTREIGVRMALGSAQSSVVWLVLRQALALVGTGVLVGAPLAIGGGKAIAAELYGLGHNPLFVIGAALLLIVVAVGASTLPARRAARVDPLIALRVE